MPYTPVTFVNGVTPLDAAKMNQLEDGVEATTAVADAAVPKSLVDAKGDIIVATGNDAPARLPVGANTQALLADSSQATGLKWGVAGAALTYEGDHVPATSYDDGDIVVKDGIAYLCVGGPTTSSPNPVPWGPAGMMSGYAPLVNGKVPVANLPISYGTSLPSSPIDGQEAILVDSVTAPTYQWRFRYNVGSGHTDKWEFVGGPPRVGLVSSFAAPSAGAFFNIATVTAPRAGLYRVDVWGRGQNNTGSPAEILFGHGAITWSRGTAVAGAYMSGYASYLTTVTAGAAVPVQGYVTALPVQFDYTEVQILPIRVS